MPFTFHMFAPFCSLPFQMFVSCQLIEHILSSQVMQHLSIKYFLLPEQHEFRKGYSCTMTLIELFHELWGDIDLGGQINCIFLDYRNAFDTVSHSLLMYKLSLLNINTNILIWLGNYLSSRQQCVVFKRAKLRFCACNFRSPTNLCFRAT